mgnify:FL=1
MGRKFVIEKAKKFLEEKKLESASISIFVCGRRKMRELSRRYLRVVEDHEVLSFPYVEVKTDFVDFPDGILRLGDIAVCFPLAQQQAMIENKMTDEVIVELVEHGILHLLGEHHPE